MPVRDPRRLDLRALLPLVVARDRDEVGAGPDRRLPHPVVGQAVVPGPDDLVAGRQASVVPRTDRRRAQKASGVRLRAEAAEERAVPGDDVVGVQPVESGRLRAPDEGRVTEDTYVLERLERLGPVRCRIAVGVVEVEVGEAPFVLEPCDVLRGASRCPPAVRLEVDRDLAVRAARPPARRGAGARARASRSPTTRRPRCRLRRPRSRASAPRRP